MKFIDFGVFQNFKQMLSHDKIIFHMLFGAFQITPRIDQNVHHFIFLLTILNSEPPITGGNMKCPKKHVKDDFVM